MPPEAAQPSGMPEKLVPSGPKAYQAGEPSSQLTLDSDDDDQTSSRRRYRSDRGPAVAPPESAARSPGPPPPPPPGNTVYDSASGLNPTLTRELVNR
jgi:hypothetical protein